MSLKDLFKDIEIQKSLVNKSENEIASEVESVDYHKADIKNEKRFIPAVDYSQPENFARYGSAKKYYTDAITNIYKTYPYDGSLYERIDWHNSSSYVDLYVLENEYPRSTGYINFSYGEWGDLAAEGIIDGYGLPASLEYISLKGGPGLGGAPQSAGANIWNTSQNRESNLELDLTEGTSVEFWLKKDAFDATKSPKEVVFDLWNYANSSSADYGRFRIDLTGSTAGTDPFKVTLMSGTVGFVTASVCASTFTAANVADGAWHHYAFTLKSASAGITSRFYVDGNLNNESTLGSVGINKVNGSMMAYIGALRTAPSGTTTPHTAEAGAGKLSGSLDEFRYWKTQRTSKDIGRYWFTQVGGGTNTDTANTDLGVYYKFNEGITGIASTDLTILDYSGRVTNGAWTRDATYYTGIRNTGSAIISSSASPKEFEDPIIYSSNPLIGTTQTRLEATGSDYDITNNASMFNMFPSWMQEKDIEKGSGLENLAQIMASYFDSLHLQIESLNQLKDVSYISGSDKPNVFSNRLLEGRGFLSPDLFLDADVLEKLADRSEDRLYDKSLTDIKNIIYKNIYNNLIHIYKSKGTLKSFRNLIRCFGIGEEIIKINMYGDNVEYEFRDNRTLKSVRKKFIDFNNIDRFGGSVYQQTSSLNTNTVGYITGSFALTGGYAQTIEAEVIFPKKLPLTHPDANTQEYLPLSASLFGMHSASTDNAGDTTWGVDDAPNFQVYSVRDKILSKATKFILSSSQHAGGVFPILTSSYYSEVYDNSKWTFAVKTKPSKYPTADYITDSTNPNDYIVEFFGIQTDAGVTLNQFSLTGTISAPAAGFVTGSKRLYAGSHRQNFTGSLLTTTDIKVGALRYWLDYLEDDIVLAHATDVENYGRPHPLQNSYVYQHSASLAEEGNFGAPQIETLALNWDFSQVTGSNPSGEFVVSDYSSGSQTSTILSSRYGFLSPILGKQHPGLGFGFPATSLKVVDTNFIPSAQLNLPENLYSEDTIKVLNVADEIQFVQDSRPINFFFAFEKSMYQSISEEMLKMFSTIVDFNNLVGAPVNKYRPNYKDLSKLRQLFFENIEDDPDLDKYIEFYKWFDSALTLMLSQLVPAGAAFSPKINLMIESHILERNKYDHKFPTLEMETPDVLGPIQSILPLSPGWEFTHHPVDDRQDTNINWWKALAERNSLSSFAVQLSSSNAGVNFSRTRILNTTKQTRDRKKTIHYRDKFSLAKTIYCGTNYHRGKKKDLVYTATTPAGPLVPGTNIPRNVMLAFGKDVEQAISSIDDLGLRKKKRLDFVLDAQINKGDDPSAVGDANLLAPFSLYKVTSSSPEFNASVNFGYNAIITSGFTGSVVLTNLHADTYGYDMETPVQSPFTEKFVGGRQVRHVALNISSSRSPTFSGLDSADDRAEGYKILTGIDLTRSPFWSSDGALGMVSLDYPDPGSPAVSPPYLYNRPKAIYLRDEVAKRPVNIKNILMTGAVPQVRLSGTIMHSKIGNYIKNYQVVQTAGRSINDPFFNDQSFSFAQYPETLGTRGRFLAGRPFTHSTLFNGADSHIDIGTGATWNGHIGEASPNTRPCSFSFWFKGDSSLGDTYPYIVCFGNNARYFRLWGTSWPMPGRFGVVNDAGAGSMVETDTDFAADTWYHVVCTFDGDDSGDMKVYVNGAEDDTGTLTGDPGTIGASDECTIGSYYNGSGYNYDGYLCDVAVWSKELSQADVTEVYNNGRRWNLKSATASNHLVSWWLLGDNPWDSDHAVMKDQMFFQNGTPNNFNDEAIQKVSPPFVGAPSNNLSGNLAYEIPQRTGSNSNQTVIVNRFGAPGGYEVASNGYMDPAHEEKSVYNALPFRNLFVRNFAGINIVSGSEDNQELTDTPWVMTEDQSGHWRSLGALLTLHCGPYGSDPRFLEAINTGSLSAPAGGPLPNLVRVDALYTRIDVGYSSCEPAYHKVNRNRRPRLELSGNFTGSDGFPLVTGSRYDNWYVQHPIPQSDRQYAWITASIQPASPWYGYDEKEYYKYYPNTASVVFDGSADYVAIGTHATWNSLIGGSGGEAKPFSISLWFRDADLSSYSKLIEFGDEDRTIYTNSSHGIRFDIDGATNGRVKTGTADLNNDQWHHIVATFEGGDPDGATGGGMKLYLDGVDRTTAVNDLDGTKDIANNNCSIGADIGASAGYFDGNIDEVSIWSSVLNASQVSRLYNKGNAHDLRRMATGNLLSWWRMGDGTQSGNPSSVVDGTSGLIYDQVGGRNGTLTSMTYASISSTSVPGSRYEVEGYYPMSDALISGSEFGSYQADFDSRYYGYWTDPIALGDYPGFLPTSFAGQNDNIREAVSCAQNLLGFKVGYPIDYYINIGNQGQQPDIGIPMYGNTFIELVRTGTGGFNNGHVAAFNALMLHRNGPYQYPSWKQIRTGENPVARSHKKQNVLSIRDGTYGAHTQAWTMWQNPRPQLLNNFTNYIEPCVASEHYPLEHIFVSLNKYDTKEGKQVSKRQVRKYISSFGNKIEYFSNLGPIWQQLNLKYNTDRGDLYFNRMNSLFMKAKAGIHTPFLKMLRAAANYKQRVYPAAYNAYLNRTRTRENYTITNIWNDSRTTRTVTDEEYMSWLPVNPNPFDQANPEASIWPLDASTLFATSASAMDTPYNGAGELQNNFTRYAMTPYVDSNFTTVNPYQYLANLLTASTALYNVPIPVGQTSTGVPVMGGQAEWTAAAEANKRPYASYEEYCKNLRLIGKDYSIVPEFRISEKMDFYINQKGGDFLAPTTYFELSGGSISDESETYSLCGVESDFFKTYMNSDFLKLFRIVDEKYDNKVLINDDVMKRDMIGLECTALLKFLPYKGFYPAERSLELSRLFSSSYSGHIEQAVYNGAENETFGPGTAWAHRPLIDPLFAPGILFNTVKAGIAVDNYIIFNTVEDKDDLADDQSPRASCAAAGVGTGTQLPEGMIMFPSASLLSMSAVPDTTVRGSQYPNPEEGGDATTAQYGVQRIPFEALLRPRNYLNQRAISGSWIIDQPGIQTGSLYWNSSGSTAAGLPVSMDSHRVRWYGGGSKLYELAADNFACEAVNFFQKGLTSFTSEIQDKFSGDFAVDKTYAMRLNLYRTLDPIAEHHASNNSGLALTSSDGGFLMYNRASAFGMPCALDQSHGDMPDGGPIHSASFAHVTPPYFDGSGSCTIVYRPKFKGKPLLDNVWNDSTFVYDRALPRGTTSDAMGSWFAMQLSSSFNLKKSVLGPSPLGNFATSPRWLLQSKFETPVLNFASVTSTEPYPPYDRGSGLASRPEANINVRSSFNIGDKVCIPAYNPDLGYTSSAEVVWTCFSFDKSSGGDTYNGYGQTQILAITGSGDETMDHMRNAIDYVLGPSAAPGTDNGAPILYNAPVRTDVGSIYYTHLTHSYNNIAMPPTYPGPLTVDGPTPPKVYGWTSWAPGGGATSGDDFSIATKGMWHQYGAVPVGAEGVFAEITIPRVVTYTGTDGSTITVRNPEDLATRLGFEVGTPQRVGEVKSGGQLEEAVVALPFILCADGRRKFFELNQKQVKLILKLREAEKIPFADSIQLSTKISKTITHQIDMMEKYVFPPRFDFVMNPEMTPFAMYIFEFSLEMDQIDYVDMWQNLPPGHEGSDSFSSKIEKKVSRIKHKLLARELLGRDEVNEDLQWVVFKVKKRAESNYNNFTQKESTIYKGQISKGGIRVEDIRVIDPKPEMSYSYNWPYDYFSLVELVKVDVSLQYTSHKKPDSTVEITNDELDVNIVNPLIPIKVDE